MKRGFNDHRQSLKTFFEIVPLLLDKAVIIVAIIVVVSVNSKVAGIHRMFYTRNKHWYLESLEV